MKVFLYEFVSGGGCFHESIGAAPEGSLLEEGQAMWRAVHDDLAGIKGIEVITTRDSRLPAVDVKVVEVKSDDSRQFIELAQACDFSLVIAPEFDHHLLDRVRQLERNGCRLLGPDAVFIELTTDKSATVNCLQSVGIPVPYGELVRAEHAIPQDFQFPAVVKANDGAGSMGSVIHAAPQPFDRDMRMETLLSGIACSQSFLCRGEQEAVACPPMRQLISEDGLLRYLGGERLMDPDLACRAATLGRRAILALPPTNGYVGVDMILGEDPDKNGDHVIEVNPRLTTSYIGLRALTQGNLALAMLDIARGNQPHLEFNDQPIRFRANGTMC